MKVEIESYEALCGLRLFKINEIEADEYAFVEKSDHNPSEAEDYGCGNMQAEIIASTKEILDKYNITEKEFQEIAEKVSEELSFGQCDWCV